MFQISIFTKDEEWPKSPFSVTQQKRRRLEGTGGTDRWKEEEKEMKQLFLQRGPAAINFPVSTNSVDTSHLRDARMKLDNTQNLEPNESLTPPMNRELQLPPISKTCVDPNDPVVPCPPENLAQICDKYNGGDFETCFQTCKPSVCIIIFSFMKYDEIVSGSSFYYYSFT